MAGKKRTQKHDTKQNKKEEMKEEMKEDEKMSRRLTKENLEKVPTRKEKPDDKTWPQIAAELKEGLPPQTELGAIKSMIFGTYKLTNRDKKALHALFSRGSKGLGAISIGQKKTTTGTKSPKKRLHHDMELSDPGSHEGDQGNSDQQDADEEEEDLEDVGGKTIQTQHSLKMDEVDFLKRVVDVVMQTIQKQKEETRNVIQAQPVQSQVGATSGQLIQAQQPYSPSHYLNESPQVVMSKNISTIFNDADAVKNEIVGLEKEIARTKAETEEQIAKATKEMNDAVAVLTKAIEGKQLKHTDLIKKGCELTDRLQQLFKNQ